MESRFVCVIGLGNIGLPVAQHIDKFFKTVGYDINEDMVIRARKNEIPASRHLYDAEIYVVCVNTWFRNGIIDMSSVKNICKEIWLKGKADSLVCFESTLSVGTSRQLANQYSLKNVVVCPHRWWKEDQENHGVVQLRVIGALNEESMNLGRRFYERLGISIFPLSSLEMAELVKITENSHRFVQIAFAEELKMIAEKNNLDFEELRKACNTKWNIDIPEARDGIGGECLPKDIRYLLSISSGAPLLQGAILADEQYKPSSCKPTQKTLLQQVIDEYRLGPSETQN